MAIKERVSIIKKIEGGSEVGGDAKKIERVTLSVEDCRDLIAFLSTNPESLSMEIKKAIENHKRIKDQLIG